MGNGKQKHGETQRLRARESEREQALGLLAKEEYSPCPLRGGETWEALRVLLVLVPPACFASSPEFSCLQRSLPELLPSWTCPSPGPRPPVRQTPWQVTNECGCWVAPSSCPRSLEEANQCALPKSFSSSPIQVWRERRRHFLFSSPPPTPNPTFTQGRDQ